MAKAALPRLEGRAVPDAPPDLTPACKATTQEDMESDWFVWWCRELKVAPVWHRKLWEYAYLLQALHQAGFLAPGSSGIGFGCGEEPIASYLAARGVSATVTDLAPDRAEARGWIESGQHAGALDTAFHSDLVDRESFDRLVSHRWMDMTAIPDDIGPVHDFCWSICSLEHLGSLRAGMDFVEASLKVLKPGGIAIHTTEFNFGPAPWTLARGPTVLYKRRHFRALHRRLAAAGHHPAPLDFDIGTQPLDRFVDVPPYRIREVPEVEAQVPALFSVRLKLRVEGYPVTCFGIIVRKAAR